MASIAPVQRSYNEMPGLEEYRTWGAGVRMGSQSAFLLRTKRFHLISEGVVFWPEFAVQSGRLRGGSAKLEL